MVFEFNRVKIPSDPDLESQINDRISFKSFLGLPMDQPSPDHSTFSRFRSRLSKKAMVQLNSALLSQFDRMGITINEGIAVDARLIKSASKPVSNDKLDELRQKHDSPATLTKMARKKSSPVILNRTGPSKTTSLILV